MNDTKETTYVVKYTYYRTMTQTFQGSYEDGTTARSRALDYYDAALVTQGARCVITRDGQLWLDTSWK